MVVQRFGNFSVSCTLSSMLLLPLSIQGMGHIHKKNICGNLEQRHKFSTKRKRKNIVIKKAPSEIFFPLYSFPSIANKNVPYIFCSFWLETRTEKGTYFLFIFSLFVSFCFLLESLFSWSTCAVQPSARHSHIAFDSRMNVLNVDFAHFDTFRFCFGSVYSGMIRFSLLGHWICRMQFIFTFECQWCSPNIYGKIIIICLFPQGNFVFWFATVFFSLSRFPFLSSTRSLFSSLILPFHDLL